METEKLRIGQWVSLRKGDNMFVGVIANAGTKEKPCLFFAGVDQCGCAIAISIEYLNKYEIKQANL
jgi:hypothetical protein